MKIKNIKLINFKKFSELYLEFSDNLNFIIGKNGSGKTSVIEAISYISIPRSFRNVKDEDLIKFNESGFSIEANISNLIEHNIKIIYKKFKDKKIKTILLDGKKQKTFLKIFEKITILTFHNYNYIIIEQSPELKRKFFDWFFSLLSYEYFVNLYKYKKALEQKNKALKNKSDIKIWNAQLKVFSNFITKTRETFIKKLNSIITEQNNSIKILYINSLKDKNIDDFEEIEKQKGYSIIGPHRDNYEFYYNGHNAKIYASDGEKRKIFLELVMSMIKLTMEIKNIKPIILFDDPFNVLDEDNFIDFLNKVENFDLQFIITGINLSKKLKNNINVISLS